MQKIATVKFVQIQREPLKIVQNPNNSYDDRIYRTSPIQRVDRIQLTAQGIIGVMAEDQQLVDVHNETHPKSRYRGGNKISFGFIQHYDRMIERFGDHLSIGDAAENIVLSADVDVIQLKTSHRFFIKHDDEMIELTDIVPAPPCRPFSVYCAGGELHGNDLKVALQFLDNGTRGYYAEWVERDTPRFIQAGDELYIS